MKGGKNGKLIALNFLERRKCRNAISTCYRHKKKQKMTALKYLELRKKWKIEIVCPNIVIGREEKMGN